MVDDDLPVSPRRSGSERSRRRAGERTQIVRGRATPDEPPAAPPADEVPEADPTEVLVRARSRAEEARNRPAPTRADTQTRADAQQTAGGRRRGGAGATPLRSGRRRSRRGLVVTIVLLLLGLVAAPFVYVACSGLNSIHNIKREAGLLPGGERAGKKVEGAMTILLAGHDKPDPNSNKARSDSMMLMHIPADRRHVYVVSTPRDMWVPVPGQRWSKINAAFADGGAALTVRTLETFMDIRIDHVAMIDFEGFIRLTDALGGVTVHNKIASTEAKGKFVYPEGDVTIQGDAALAYVRQRHELPNGDLDRSERQRAVVKGIISKALSAGVVSNPAKLSEFVDKASKTITLDDTFTDADVRGLILSMKVTSGSDVRTMQAPIAGFATTSRGEAIDVVDQEALKEIGDAIRSDTLDAYWDAHPKPKVMTGNKPRGALPEGPVPEQGLSLADLAAQSGGTGTEDARTP